MWCLALQFHLEAFEIMVNVLCKQKVLPYSGKLSIEKTFANWWKIRFSRRKPSGFCRATTNFAEKTFVNSHKTAKFARKFSTSKFFRPLGIPPLFSLTIPTQQYKQKSNSNKSQSVFRMKASETRWEWHHNTFILSLHLVPFCQLNSSHHKTVYLAY